jgi:hypothetical protein
MDPLKNTTNNKINCLPSYLTIEKNFLANNCLFSRLQCILDDAIKNIGERTKLLAEVAKGQQ